MTMDLKMNSFINVLISESSFRNNFNSVKNVEFFEQL